MKNVYSQKLFVVLFVCLLFSVLILAGCNDTEPTPTTEPVITTQPPVKTEPTEPTQPEDNIWNGLTADSFVSYVSDYTGSIGEHEFTGVVFQSTYANSSTTLTKDAVVELRKYARANEYDGLRVYVYPAEEDGDFIIGSQKAYYGKWNKIEISLADLDSLTAFKSQSKHRTETYMYFEFIKLPAINITSFLKDVYTYSGTVGGKTFDGFVFKSSEYQPTTYFQEYAIEDIKAYAQENGFNALRISCYPIQQDNAFLVGGNSYRLNNWGSVDFSIAHITSEFAFWSQSQGATENYMYFEFVNVNNPVIPSGKTGPKKPSSPYFTSTKGYSVEKYSGTVADVKFEGFKFTSTVYQPDFYFTQKAIREILDAAEKSGNNFLRIHSYAILKDNSFVVGKQNTRNGEWSTTDVYVADLSTSFRFWSQSQGSTEVYLWFEMYHLDIPDASSNINSGYFQPNHKSDGSQYRLSFYDYMGEAGGAIINGIHVKSSDYQPKFSFTSEGVAAIKAYAADNHVNFLKIHSYAILYDNGFMVGNNHTGADQWNETEIFIDSLSEGYTFWSQSQGATEVYLWFEYYQLDIPETNSEIDANYFEPSLKSDGTKYSLSFSDYKGNAGDTVINGIEIKSSDYQPKFKFTADGIAYIKEYAANNNFNVLRIHAYAILKDNLFVVNNSLWVNNSWKTLDVNVDELTESFMFWSQSQGASEIYLWFEMIYVEPPVVNPYNQIIHAGSFNGSAYEFEDYQGTVGDRDFTGIKATSDKYQPKFYFTPAAITEIQTYAANNNYDTLRIHAYAILKDNSFVVNNSLWVKDAWKTIEVNVSDITDTFTFWSQSQGTSEIYLRFEFVDTNPFDQVIYAQSFVAGKNADNNTDSVWSFENYQGTVGDKEIIGVKATSESNQPSFHLTEKAVEDVMAYAVANNVNSVRISGYIVGTDEGFGVNDTVWSNNNWNTVEISISELSTEFKFFSGSQSLTEAYLIFEFFKVEIIDANSFGNVFTIEDFAGVVAEREIVGIKLTSTGRQRDAFNTDAIAEIKAYAEAFGYTSLKISVYVELDNNAFTVFGQSITKNQWNEITVSIDSLTTSTRIQTTCTGNTEAYLVFEFV